MYCAQEKQRHECVCCQNRLLLAQCSRCTYLHQTKITTHKPSSSRRQSPAPTNTIATLESKWSNICRCAWQSTFATGRREVCAARTSELEKPVTFLPLSSQSPLGSLTCVLQNVKRRRHPAMAGSCRSDAGASSCRGCFCMWKLPKLQERNERWCQAADAQRDGTMAHAADDLPGIMEVHLNVGTRAGSDRFKCPAQMRKLVRYSRPAFCNLENP